MCTLKLLVSNVLNITFLLAYNTLFPAAVISFISSSPVLSLFTMEPRYLKKNLLVQTQYYLSCSYFLALPFLCAHIQSFIYSYQ